MRRILSSFAVYAARDDGIGDLINTSEGSSGNRQPATGNRQPATGNRQLGNSATGNRPRHDTLFSASPISFDCGASFSAFA
jgi:hypothetical protein